MFVQLVRDARERRVAAYRIVARRVAELRSGVHALFSGWAMRTLALVGAGSLLTCGVAWATETITYSYDARGRLIRVERSGDVSNGVVTNYTLDNMSNRTRVTVNGSANAPPS